MSFTGAAPLAGDGMGSGGVLHGRRGRRFDADNADGAWELRERVDEARVRGVPRAGDVRHQDHFPVERELSREPLRLRLHELGDVERRSACVAPGRLDSVEALKQLGRRELCRSKTVKARIFLGVLARRSHGKGTQDDWHSHAIANHEVGDDWRTGFDHHVADEGGDDAPQALRNDLRSNSATVAQHARCRRVLDVLPQLDTTMEVTVQRNSEGLEALGFLGGETH
mmetsp:Transcript_20378/g.63328  ORF Transcript_20378/g.63328 Transcript_20378/m.63328 type:complete len:226 (-) Transcript_20378:493-1170(-)